MKLIKCCSLLTACTLFAILLSTAVLLILDNFATPVHYDLSQYNIVLYRTVAHKHNSTHPWVIPIHGYVYEKENELTMRFTTKYVVNSLLHNLLNLLEPNDDLKNHILDDWMRFSAAPDLSIPLLFELTDRNDSAAPIVKQVNIFTDHHGYLDHSIYFTTDEMKLLQRRSAVGKDGDKWYTYHVAGTSTLGSVKLTSSGTRQTSDGMELLSVVSDIDDTIKHTNVLSVREMLANTFLKKFEHVPHMNDLYTKWMNDYHIRTEQYLKSLSGESESEPYTEEVDKLLFHYVSSSPSPLYDKLDEFLSEFKFPVHSIHLRKFSAIDRTILNMFKSSRKTKPVQIEQIITTHSERRFILVGDSQEHDPIIYANLFKKYPQQIKHIFIRCPCAGNTGCCSRTDQRFVKHFQGVPDQVWHVFSDARELLDFDILGENNSATNLL